MFWAPGVIVLLLGHTCLGLEVIAPPSVIASLRSPAVLPCNFSIAAPSINSQFLAIIWYYGDQILLTIDNKGIQDKQGFYINEQEAKKGNATLTIHNVTIADQGTYKCLIIYSPDRQHREIKLNVHAPPRNMIQRKALDKGQKSQLFCFISDFFPEEVKVTWLRNNAPILGGSEMGSLHRNADGTYRVNSSVVLTPDQIQDRPTIVCQVEHVSIKQPIKDAYTVQFGVAPKVRLFPSKTSDNNELIYVCEATGFSPEPLTINWLVNGKSVDLSRVSEDGVFNKRIYYQINLKEDNVPVQISCNVQHETLSSPIKKNTEVNMFNECTRNCHLGLTALLSVLLIASILFISFLGYLIMKKKYFRRFEVSHIHQEHAWDNKDMVNLYCMALNWPKGAQATWTVNIDGREPITVQDCQEYKDEEKGPLLHPGYIMRTDRTESNELSNFTTKLSFNPETSGYKKMDIKCRFLCGRRSKERSLTCTFHISKPEIKELIKKHDDDENAVYCVTLEKFYPSKIQIQWSYGGGDQYKDIKSTEEITHNTEHHTYKAVSTCKIPREALKKIRVTWKHLSMDQPGSHEKTVSDIHLRPVMEDILIPSLIHGTEAKLKFDIRGYYPKDLKVTWLRREAGKSDLYEVSASDKYKIPVIDSIQQPDKTYTCTASLILSVSGITEHGSEFICRVTHPSLETYVEKRTGELSVKGIPVIKMEYQNERLRAIISNFCPNNITVTWGRRQLNEKEKKNDKPKDINFWKTLSNDKMKSYEAKEIKVVAELNNEDGTFTSIREITPKKDSKVYKVTVEHESLKSPASKIIWREKGIYYVEENGEKISLNQKVK